MAVGNWVSGNTYFDARYNARKIGGKTNDTRKRKNYFKNVGTT
jgi:hypothetical protein